MSWSFNGVGKPAALKAAIDKAAEGYSGQSKAEFDDVIPHLKGMLDAAHEEAAVSIEANGHASFADGKRTYANVFVKVQQLGTIYT